MLLVLVDVMKELPATLILRPFNFDTLAVEAFQLATTERLDGAALPSLVIVAVGLVPVVLLCRMLETGAAWPRHDARPLTAANEKVGRTSRPPSFDAPDRRLKAEVGPCAVRRAMRQRTERGYFQPQRSVIIAASALFLA